MRMKDLASEFCYKFRVTNKIPVIQFHPNDNLRLLIKFEGDYVEDLSKFLSALDDPRFSLRQGERITTLEFRFISI